MTTILTVSSTTPPTPTADELEEKARNGEQISLAEYAAALKADKEQGKEKKPGIKCFCVFPARPGRAVLRSATLF